jgi:TolB-like protein/tetratricopeptide (TPR) repeat protein
MSLFAELKRRNVFRVGAAYAVIAWFIIQAADIMLDNFGAPGWVFKSLSGLLVLGFPLALFLSWAYELTPEGVKKTANEMSEEAAAPTTGRRIDRVILIALVGALTILVIERVWFATSPASLSDAAGDPADAAATVSIAVLPFVNMSANADQEYFSDGMTEEIINTLVRQTGLSVAARTSVFAFKDDNRNVSEIGRSLGVSHVIEGSVRSSNNTVRITAQLIDVASGFHAWSETYDRELTDVFAVQEEIAANVAAALTTSLVKPRTAPDALTTSDPEAYRKFLQARSLLRQRGEASVARAAELLEEVTRLDPDFAPGWATAAIVANVSNRLDAAFDYAERALALDPDNVDALTALASSHRASWQWRDAERVFERALALDPESSELLEDYAEFLGMVGRFDEMLEVGEKGFLIDPYLPPLAGVYAEALMIAGRPEDAAQVMTEALIPSSPGWLVTYAIAASLQMDRPDQALEILRGRDAPSAALGRVIAVFENPADDSAVAELESWLDSNLETEIFEVMVGQFALLHAGRPERVLEFQARLVERNQQGELEWIFAPLFEELRRLPGFIDYLEAVNLPAYWDATAWPEVCERIEDGEIRCND